MKKFKIDLKDELKADLKADSKASKNDLRSSFGKSGDARKSMDYFSIISKILVIGTSNCDDKIE